MAALLTRAVAGVGDVGLAAAGEAGVARVLSIFRAEIERDMSLMGRIHIADITADDVEHISQFRAKPGSARASA